MGATYLAREREVLGGRLMAALVSQVTHDLNNHLAAMLGKAEFGLLVADSERKTAALSGVLEPGEAARRLVADLQRLAAFIEGAGDPVPAVEVAQLAVRLHYRRLKRAGIRAECRATGPGPLRPRAAAAALALWWVLRRLLEEPGSILSGTLELAVGCAGRDDEIAIRIDGARPPVDGLDDLEGPMAEVGARLQRQGGRIVVILS